MEHAEYTLTLRDTKTKHHLYQTKNYPSMICNSSEQCIHQYSYSKKICTLNSNITKCLKHVGQQG